MIDHEQRIKELESTLTVRNAQLSAALIDVPAIREFSQMGGRSEAIEDACNRAKQAFRLDDGNLTPTHHANGAASIRDFVEQLQTNAPHMFGKPGAAQPAAKPYNGINPWKRDTFNLTKQGEIVRADPHLAQQLQAEARQ